MAESMTILRLEATVRPLSEMFVVGLQINPFGFT